MAAIRSSGTWGSALTTDEFAAIRSAGFEPVGQVLGAAAYAAGSASGYSCPGTRGSPGDGVPARLATEVSGRGGPGSFGPLVQAMYQARDTAIGRMTAECAALGGHGVVGVRLSRGSFPLGGLEFTAIGTAIRAPGAAHGPPVPFTSDLSGQDFAKLIMTGWVPAGLVLGISIGSRHDDRTTARQARWGSGNAEVAGGPSWSASRGATPGTSWKARSGGSAPREWSSPPCSCGHASGTARCRSAAATTSSRQPSSALPSPGSPAPEAIMPGRPWPSCRSTRSGARRQVSGSNWHEAGPISPCQAGRGRRRTAHGGRTDAFGPYLELLAGRRGLWTSPRSPASSTGWTWWHPVWCRVHAGGPTQAQEPGSPPR